MLCYEAAPEICSVLGMVLSACYEICQFKIALLRGCPNDVYNREKRKSDSLGSTTPKGNESYFLYPLCFLFCQSLQLYLFLESIL